MVNDTATVTYIKYKPGGNSSKSALRAVINYCLQPYKTEIGEKVYCTSGQDCTPQFSYREFMATKAAYGKENGVYFYHYVQSFSPQEKITPEMANAIAQELAKEWKSHEVLMATHVDREHIHTHFIINSVSFETGRKLRQDPNTLKKLREVSDNICKRYGLSVLEPYEKAKTSGLKTGEYRTAVRRDSWKFRLIAAITFAMKNSYTRLEFIRNMKEQGYGVTWSDDRKHITYTCLREPKFKDGSYRKCRDDKLHGEKFLKENMEAEFDARQELYAAILYGTVDRNERKAARDESRTRAATDGGTAVGEAMERSHSGDQSDLQTDKYNDRGHRESAGLGGESGEGSSGDRDWESPVGTEGTNQERDPKTDGSRRTTGWESSRESLGKDQPTGKKGRRTVVAETGSVRGNTIGGHGAYLGINALSALGPTENGEETEEEKRRREAQNAGSAIGAAIGLAVGIASALSKNYDANSDAETPSDDEDQGSTMTM